MDTTQRTKEQREDFLNELALEDYMFEKNGFDSEMEE